MSMKASDETVVPLTRKEHQEYHQMGKRAFERKYWLKFTHVSKRLQAEWAKNETFP
jgi:hypothetical protein